jgi:hypothetical protein
MIRGSAVSSKIDTSLLELKDAASVSKFYLPKLPNGHASIPKVYDYSSYRLNAWEDDKLLMRKYRDFMDKPT